MPQARAAASFEPSANMRRQNTVSAGRAPRARPARVSPTRRWGGRAMPALGIVTTSSLIHVAGTLTVCSCQPLGHAARDAQHPQRDDERHDAKCGDHGAVRHPDRSASCNSHHHGQRRRPAGAQRERGDHAGEGDDRSHREVDPSADDDHRHPDGTERGDHRLRQHDAQVERREESPGLVGEESKDEDDGDQAERGRKTSEEAPQRGRGDG